LISFLGDVWFPLLLGSKENGKSGTANDPALAKEPTASYEAMDYEAVDYDDPWSDDEMGPLTSGIVNTFFDTMTRSTSWRRPTR
jgi:hypothetical protein